MKRKLLDRCAKAQFRVLDFGEKAKAQPKRKKFYLAEIKKEKKIFSLVCDKKKTRTEGDSQVYGLQKKVLKGLKKYAKKMLKSPDKLEDGKFIRKNIASFLRKTFKKSIRLKEKG